MLNRAGTRIRRNTHTVLQSHRAGNGSQKEPTHASVPSERTTMTTKAAHQNDARANATRRTATYARSASVTTPR